MIDDDDPMRAAKGIKNGLCYSAAIWVGLGIIALLVFKW